MELESIIKMRLAAAALVEVGAAQAALQPAANSASKTLIFFINLQVRFQRNTLPFSPQADFGKRNLRRDGVAFASAKSVTEYIQAFPHAPQIQSICRHWRTVYPDRTSHDFLALAMG
jgi:hypothetical protein